MENYKKFQNSKEKRGEYEFEKEKEEFQGVEVYSCNLWEATQKARNSGIDLELGWIWYHEIRITILSLATAILLSFLFLSSASKIDGKIIK